MENSDGDPVSDGLNKAISKSVSELVEKIFKGVYGKGKSYYNRRRISKKDGFEEYVASSISYNTKVKTILNRVQPVDIRKIFADLFYEKNLSEHTYADILERFIKGDQLVITGSAGFGKSFTMKYLYLDAFDCGIIPVYVELKDLNNSTTTLLDFISQKINVFCEEFDKKAVLYGIRNGIIALVLDGFDELLLERQKAIQKEILELVSQNPVCRLVVSSRPSVIFEAWPTFFEFRLKKLKRAQIYDLVSKAVFGADSKSKFIRNFESGAYDAYSELLSNPLFVYMMLAASSDLPNPRVESHTFYQKAFELLSYGHDAFKIEFVRHFRSGMTPSAIERFFRAFCYLSYFNKEFEFRNEDSIVQSIAEAAQYENVQAPTKDILYDLISNVCIIYEEGGLYKFIHGSFQEFFCADFMIKNRGPEIEIDIEDLLGEARGIGVINFCHQINPTNFEEYYLIKQIEKMVEAANLLAGQREKLALFFNKADIKDGVLYEIPYDGALNFSAQFELIVRYHRDKNFRYETGRHLQRSAAGFETRIGPKELAEIVEESRMGDQCVEWVRSVLTEMRSRQKQRLATRKKRRSLPSRSD